MKYYILEKLIEIFIRLCGKNSRVIDIGLKPWAMFKMCLKFYNCESIS